MIETLNMAETDIFGLFELSTDGTVLYSRARDNGQLSLPGSETIGRDFFLDVARFENRADLRRHFKNFITSARSVDNFAFDCDFGGEIVKTKINMTRAREYDYDHAGGIVILDIKRAGS